MACNYGPTRASRNVLKFGVAALGSVLFVLNSIGLLGPFDPRLRAQGIPSDEVRLSSRPYRPGMLRAESLEVEVGVVVLNESGRAVAGLKQEDFSVYDDGKKQQLSGFTIINRIPRTGPNPDSTPSSQTVATNPQSTTPTSQPNLLPRRPRYVALLFDDFHTKPGDI